MNVKRIYLAVLEQKQMEGLMRYVWRNLKTEEDGSVFVEFETTKEPLLRSFKQGTVYVAQGVRLRLDYVYVQERPQDMFLGTARVWRVRIVFKRLDYTPEHHQRPSPFFTVR